MYADRVWKLVGVATLLCACGAKLAGDQQDLAIDAASTAVDSGTTTVIDDAGNVVSVDAPPAPPSRVVYLNFVGVPSLKKGTPSDAKANTASWLVGNGTGTVPPYGGSQADTDIIRDGVKARLAGIATVTVSRPTTGEYVMVMYGGTAAQAHSGYGEAVAQLDCGDLVASDVAWITGSEDPTATIDTTIGAIGFGLGLSSVDRADDCFCSWGDNCTRSGACVLRNAQTRDPDVGTTPQGMQMICPGATQNELTVFTAAFQ
jgi:hypothetical protein